MRCSLDLKHSPAAEAEVIKGKISRRCAWEMLIPIGSMGLVYLATFTIKINHSCR